ncbi:hypothetical protein [Chamaesiphon sp.]|uniref:hypothetical protein n=1 Tax=Chamaesiphon sp. TaxID=2814140 RepID=UPI0035945BB6
MPDPNFDLYGDSNPLDEYDSISDALAGGVDIDDIPECRQSIIEDMDDEVKPYVQTRFPIDPNNPPIEGIIF